MHPEHVRRGELEVKGLRGEVEAEGKIVGGLRRETKAA